MGGIDFGYFGATEVDPVDPDDPAEGTVNAYVYRPLPHEKQQLVLDHIRSAQNAGAVRAEEESGVTPEHALRKFEYALVRFELAGRERGGLREEGRLEARLYIERLGRALTELQSASDNIKNLIGDDLYQGEMPERVFDALAGEYPRPIEEREAATTLSAALDDPLHWRTGLEGGVAVGCVDRWLALAKPRVEAMASWYRHPGRERGTPDSLLASDMFDLLRLLDRSDLGPVRPIRPRVLKQWLEFAHELAGVSPENNIAVTCKHAVRKAGRRGSPTHPPRPGEAPPRALFTIEVDSAMNATRTA